MKGMKEGDRRNPEQKIPPKKHSLATNTIRGLMAAGLIAGATVPAWACNQPEKTLPEPTPIATGTPIPPDGTPTLVFETPTPVPPTLSSIITPQASETAKPPEPEYKHEETKTASVEEKTSALKEEIENQFNIKLTTVNDVYGSRSLWSAKPEDMVVWNLDRLKVLEQSLTALPKHFFEHSETGDKVTVSLDIRQRANCSCGQEEVLPHRINIGTDYFESVEDLLPTMAHEFVHLVTSMEGSRSLGPSEFTSPWYKKIDQILGEEFVNVRPKLAAMAKSKVGSERMAIAMYGGGIKRNFYEEFLYGVEGYTMAAYGYRLPHEFIAVLGESYVEGKDYFDRMYGEFFPQDTVGELYNFVKEGIFKGMEFEEYLKSK